LSAVVDPRAASFPYHSSFVYAANNPITNTDFHGESALNPNNPEDPIKGIELTVDQETGNPKASLEEASVTETLSEEEWYQTKSR